MHSPSEMTRVGAGSAQKSVAARTRVRELLSLADTLRGLRDTLRAQRRGLDESTSSVAASPRIVRLCPAGVEHLRARSRCPRRGLGRPSSSARPPSSLAVAAMPLLGLAELDGRYAAAIVASLAGSFAVQLAFPAIGSQFASYRNASNRTKRDWAIHAVALLHALYVSDRCEVCVKPTLAALL